MGLVTAKEHLEKNIALLSPSRDEAMYNLNVALLELAKGLQKIERDVGDVATRVKRIESRQP